MERDKPAAADLLKTARSLMREELLAHLPAEQKLNGLMIANAMAIAARELEVVRVWKRKWEDRYARSIRR